MRQNSVCVNHYKALVFSVKCYNGAYIYQKHSKKGNLIKPYAILKKSDKKYIKKEKMEVVFRSLYTSIPYDKILDFLVGDMVSWKHKYNNCIREINKINSIYDIDTTRSSIVKLVSLKCTIGLWKHIHKRGVVSTDIINSYYYKRPPESYKYIFNKLYDIFLLRINYNKLWKPVKNILSKKEYDKLHYIKNIEKKKEQSKNYYNNNKEYFKNYNIENIEKKKEYDKLRYKHTQ